MVRKALLRAVLHQKRVRPELKLSHLATEMKLGRAGVDALGRFLGGVSDKP